MVLTILDILMSVGPFNYNSPVLKGNLIMLFKLDMYYIFCFADCTIGLGCHSSLKDHVSVVSHLIASQCSTQLANRLYRDQTFCIRRIRIILALTWVSLIKQVCFLVFNSQVRSAASLPDRFCSFLFLFFQYHFGHVFLLYLCQKDMYG